VNRCGLEVWLRSIPVKVIGVEPSSPPTRKPSFRAGMLCIGRTKQGRGPWRTGCARRAWETLRTAHIHRFGDDMVTVREEKSGKAVRRLSVSAKLAAEPSGASRRGAFLFHRSELPQTTRNVAILSGGNIDPALLGKIQNEPPMGTRSQPVGLACVSHSFRQN